MTAWDDGAVMEQHGMCRGSGVPHQGRPACERSVGPLHSEPHAARRSGACSYFYDIGGRDGR
jgi:hypothetical protein